ncbi:hypothetical protein [Polymorphospora rubra]|uniref:Uncharacterized protein n=1 Tax=Polymorphospora rubra TaxID=338584 RepID=A0A810NFZ0_9ACTN|nr:hypothetical protein [Polymorphospora rubra]BCJ70363.1 hypothetical protein Prubr_73840 [Polymorphospora rubra]
MRAKLRDDLMYVATEAGVYLETGTTSTEISGGAAYGLIRRIAPHLDGSRTVAELTESLPPTNSGWSPIWSPCSSTVASPVTWTGSRPTGYRTGN